MNATTTKTATKAAAAPVAETQAASEKREVAVFQPPRLPYHQALKDRFGIEPSGWKALVEAVFPSAKTVDAVVMALSYCKARNLDPFKRPVHIVPMWDNKARAYVETIWPGIAELRTTAARTANYAGCDAAEFGPILEETFSGKVKKGQEWETKSFTVKFPEWCRLTVYRLMPNGERCKFVGPKVLWHESYATIGRSDLPNDMWRERPDGQLEKCAEAAALRRAFPEELGNDLTAEEMTGRVIDHDPNETVGHVAPQANNGGPPAPDQVKSGAAQPTQAQPQQTADVIDVEAEEVEEGLPLDEPTTAQAQQQQEQGGQDGFTADEREWLRNLEGGFSGCEDVVSFGQKQKEIMAPMKKKVSAQAWQKAQGLAQDHYHRVSNNE